jgi:hypothetical protein
MFDSFDSDRDGKIDATELGSALAHFQYAGLSNHPIFFSTNVLSLRVAPHILDMVIKKYGESSSRSSHFPWSHMNPSSHK